MAGVSRLQGPRGGCRLFPPRRAGLPGRPGQVPALKRAGGIGRGPLWTLLIGEAVSEIGIGFFLPILPLYLSSRGGSPFLVGVIFASGVVGAGVAQYPGGRAADRFGPKPVIVLSLLIYSLLFVAYLLPIPVALLIPLRFVHAFFAGFYRPAAGAMLAELSSNADRGHAFGLLRAADTSGLLIGPVLGGVVATYRLEGIFWAGLVLCLTATLLMLRLPAARASVQVGSGPPRHPLRLLRILLPVLLLSLPIQWVFGNYDAVWSLYMSGLGATRLQIGLSFAVYALPIIALSGILGRVGDRFGYRSAATVAVASYAVMNLVYTATGNVWLLIWLGLIEGGFTAAGTPALAAEVSRGAPPGQQGRTQGVYGAAQTLFQALAALVGGALFGVKPVYAFFATAAVCVVCLALSALVRGPGRSAGGGPELDGVEVPVPGATDPQP